MEKNLGRVSEEDLYKWKDGLPRILFGDLGGVVGLNDYQREEIVRSTLDIVDKKRREAYREANRPPCTDGVFVKSSSEK
jgi:hypothetical protein